MRCPCRRIRHTGHWYGRAARAIDLGSSPLVARHHSMRTAVLRRPVGCLGRRAPRCVVHDDRECASHRRPDTCQHHRLTLRNEHTFARDSDGDALRCHDAVCAVENVPGFGTRVPMRRRSCCCCDSCSLGVLPGCSGVAGAQDHEVRSEVCASTRLSEAGVEREQLDVVHVAVGLAAHLASWC